MTQRSGVPSWGEQPLTVHPELEPLLDLRALGVVVDRADDRAGVLADLQEAWQDHRGVLPDGRGVKFVPDQ
jgi:hypothetical protein